ncbi:MAG: hypothetical protein ABI148_05895, partial [Ginsengibacter sp.]
MKPGKLLTFILFLFFYSNGFSQQNPALISNFRSKKVSTKINPFMLDSNSIIPNTVSVIGIPESGYNIDYVNASVLWKSTILPDSVFITYRVFPYKLNAITRRFNYDSIRFNFALEKPYTIKSNQFENKII